LFGWCFSTKFCTVSQNRLNCEYVTLSRQTSSTRIAKHRSIIKLKFLKNFCSSCKTLADQVARNPRFYCIESRLQTLVVCINQRKCANTFLISYVSCVISDSIYLTTFSCTKINTINNLCTAQTHTSISSNTPSPYKMLEYYKL
jgi:hypothetical protein